MARYSNAIGMVRLAAIIDVEDSKATIALVVTIDFIIVP
jgi:hypothetical protein